MNQLDEATVDEVRERLWRGESLRCVARALGISKGTVQRYRRLFAEDPLASAK